MCRLRAGKLEQAALRRYRLHELIVIDVHVGRF
jgi:hypothetical protein